MGQGFSLQDSLFGASSKFGVGQDQLARVQGMFNPPAPAPATSSVTDTLRNAGLQESSPDVTQVLAAPQKQPTVNNPMQGAILQAANELQPGYFLNTPTGQAAAEGEQATYMPYSYNTDQPGPDRITSGVFGGVPVTRFSENEFHVDVPAGPNKINRSIYDASGNFLGTFSVDTRGGLIDRAFPVIAQTALTAMGIPAPVASAVIARSQGAGLEGMLKSAGLAYAGQLAGGALSGVGESAAKSVGKFIDPILPEGVTGDVLKNAATTATKTITTDVGKALVGSALTGRPIDLGNVITAGAFSGIAQGTMDTISAEMGKNSLINTFPKPLKDAAFAAVAAELRGKDVSAAVINSLVNSVAREINNAAKSGTTPTKVSDAGGSDFDATAIIEPGDMGGTLVTGEGGDDLISVDDDFPLVRQDVVDQTVPLDIKRDTGAGDTFDIVDYLDRGIINTTGGADQRVDVLGNPLRNDQVDLISLIDNDLVGDRVNVTDTKLKDDSEDVNTEVGDITNQTVSVPGKKFIKPVMDADTQRGVEDITNQTVNVPGKKFIKPVDGREGGTTPTTPTTPTTTPTVTTTTPTTTTTTTRVPVAAPKAAPVAQQETNYFESLPLYQSIFYAREQERQRREELMRQAQEEDGPYERLMRMAQDNPGVAVDELMKIIEGA